MQSLDQIVSSPLQKHAGPIPEKSAGKIFPDKSPTTASSNMSQATISSTQTDEMLLAAYRHGDRASFSRIVERYQRELFHFPDEVQNN